MERESHASETDTNTKHETHKQPKRTPHTRHDEESKKRRRGGVPSSLRSLRSAWWVRDDDRSLAAGVVGGVARRGPSLSVECVVSSSPVGGVVVVVDGGRVASREADLRVRSAASPASATSDSGRHSSSRSSSSSCAASATSDRCRLAIGHGRRRRRRGFARGHMAVYRLCVCLLVSLPYFLERGVGPYDAAEDRLLSRLATGSSTWRATAYDEPLVRFRQQLPHSLDVPAPFPHVLVCVCDVGARSK